MFERYTEKARRVIFYARYEASQYGSSVIDTEHLLLGLLHEEKKTCFSWIPRADPAVIRQQIDGWLPKQPPISTAIDLPLSDAGKRALHRAKDEADRLTSKWIGTEHLLLGLMEEESSISKLLAELGGDPAQLRTLFERESQPPEFVAGTTFSSSVATTTVGPVRIHGLWRNANAIQDRVQQCKLHNWHWHKTLWRPRDLVVDQTTGKISFDTSLTENGANFEIIQGGWKKDKCAICGWELFESEDDHGSGYSNGQIWICLECYDRFWQRPDFVSGSYSDLT